MMVNKSGNTCKDWKYSMAQNSCNSVKPFKHVGNDRTEHTYIHSTIDGDMEIVRGNSGVTSAYIGLELGHWDGYS